MNSLLNTTPTATHTQLQLHECLQTHCCLQYNIISHRRCTGGNVAFKKKVNFKTKIL